MNENNEKNLILDVSNLSVRFFERKKEGKAVDNISFSVEKGKILGIVGESGSGKSVTVMSVLGLLTGRNVEIEADYINFCGESIMGLKRKEMQKIRGKRISMVFQEPMTSLNPALTIGEQIAETILQHEKTTKKQAIKRAKELLDLVQIPLAEERLKEYPYQLSGGMRQRVMIAMALACNPELIIADEPTTALDVTIQSQILELFKKLQRELNVTIILITHDMGVIAETADSVIVMYAGRIVESGTTEQILNHPRHRYTKALIKAIPKLNEEQQVLEAIPGNIPSIYSIPSGCNFHPRCPFASQKCIENVPELQLCDNRLVACFNLYDTE